MTSQSSTPQGPGSVSGAPNLPAGFSDTFTSRYVNAGDVRLHVVTGGDGPPLLLIHGWPESWYGWRMVMPALAKDFYVVAVDQRGMGISDKPQSGYDAGTQANDMVAVMDALGHKRFALIGFDTGLVISYALAADHPERIERLAVGEAPLVGITPSPPLFLPSQLNDRLFHLAFNQLAELNEQLVRGREDIWFGYELTTSTAKKPTPEAVAYYTSLFASSPDALRGSFGFYRAINTTIAQNQERKNRRLTMPVLAVGGERSSMESVGVSMKLVADNVQTAVIAGSGHFVAEEAPEQLLPALTQFLAPYREGARAGAAAG
jgi:pimeloyl-ACP methyl ester carboxylesterase